MCFNKVTGFSLEFNHDILIHNLNHEIDIHHQEVEKRSGKLTACGFGYPWTFIM